MPVLINPENGLAEDLDHPAAASALQSGWHVPLVGPDGQAHAAPYSEAHELVRTGQYGQPNALQLQDLLDHAKYTSPGQQALAFAEGAAEPLTAGTYGAIAGHTGLTSKEDVLKRSQYNPGTHTLGEMAGIAGGTLLAPEASVPGLIAKAGGAAGEAVAGAGLAGKALQLATQGAVEAGAYGATHAASEALMGDPGANAESIIGHIGLSAALGGGLNLALAPAIGGINRAIGLGTGFLGRGGNNALVKPQTLEEILPHTGLDQAERKSVIEGLTQLKPNADEITEAAKTINAPVMESQVSNSKFVQDLDSTLMKSPSWTGIQRQQMAQQGYSAATKAIDESLGNDIGMTKAEVGNRLKTGLTDRIQAEYEPINSLYNRIKGLGQTVPLEANSINSAAKEMTNIDGLLSSKGVPLSERSPGYQLAKRVSEELPNLGTVDDLRQYAQRIGQDTIGQPELKYVAGQIQSRLSELQENSILKFAQEISSELPQKAEIEGLITQHREAKQAYSQLRDKLSDLGSVMGKKLRKGEGTQAFLDWIADTAPEKVADRLFTKNNSEFLAFLGKNFPEEANLLSNLKKAQLRDSAMVDGHINPGKVLREVDKLEPEVQKFLFGPQDIHKLKAAETYLEAFPKNVNPSETAKALQLFDLFKNPLSTAATQTTDFLKGSFIKAMVKANPGEAPLINALVHLNTLTAKFARNMERHAGSLFGRGAASTAEGEQRQRRERTPASEELVPNRLGTMVMQHADDPEGLIDHLTQATNQVSQYAPATMASLSTTVGAGVQFLASKVPHTDKAAPFDGVQKPSRSDIATFNRYAEIVDNPMHVFQHVKNGTILPQDIETLQRVYPAQYAKMREAVTGRMITYLSKHSVSEMPMRTKMGLSLFLGQPLDSSLTPQGIMANQAAVMPAAMAQASQQQHQSVRPSKAGMRQMHIVDREQTRAQQTLTRSA